MKKYLIVALLLLSSYQLKADSVCSIISSPGNYLYAADNVGNPTDPDDALVCVQVSDVVVDLGGHAFTQDPSNFVGGFSGVVISPNLTNIVIKNGSIRNLTGFGIIIGEGCSNIRIENIDVDTCNAGGIQMNGVSINTIAQTASQFAAGIVMKNCKEGLVQNNLVYSSSTVNGDGSDVANGYELDSCQRILVQNCQSSVGSASAGSCNGFFAQNGDRNNFNGVLAQSNQGFLSASGIYLSNEVDSNIQGSTFRETLALTGSSTGVLIAGCTNCNIQSNNVLDSVGTYSFAIIDDSGASTSAITSNRAFNCGNGYSVTYPSSIQLPVIIGSLSLNPPGLPGSAGGLLDNILINP